MTIDWKDVNKELPNTFDDKPVKVLLEIADGIFGCAKTYKLMEVDAVFEFLGGSYMDGEQDEYFFKVNINGQEITFDADDGFWDIDGTAFTFSSLFIRKWAYINEPPKGE